MAQYRLSGEAHSDLHEIYRYGATTFGQQQADRYALGLFDQFDLLAHFPGMGLPLNLRGHNFFKSWYGTHMIVFSIEAADSIRIEFLIDGRMDVMHRLHDRINDQ